MNEPDQTGSWDSDSTWDPSSTRQQPEVPRRVGRYRVTRLLGRGGFGVVYLAEDEQLQRSVAIKVPHPRLVPEPADAEPYLREARAAASLDHANIVPVYDVGSTEDFPCFIVSKFIDGSTLAHKTGRERRSFAEAAELVAAIAEALHHAHKHGIVHRDVKPGNILIDARGTPYVADFGLALKDEDIGKGPGRAGTPLYMSPEQARGEGHRVDGRSDIFSLAVVFYEMLTARRPFRGDSREELLRQITDIEARPPRQWDDTIPEELERICLKGLAKRAADRYTTAADMARDLRRFLSAKDALEHPDRPQQNLLHAIWDCLDANLQDAFSLAYNKKVREGSRRISTRDLFQALARIDDPALSRLLVALPKGALPDPVDANVKRTRRVLDEQPLLSDCIDDSLRHFMKTAGSPRKVAPVDVFVDIGKHGHGPSVARLRQHGVTPEKIEEKVKQHGLSVMRRDRS